MTGVGPSGSCGVRGWENWGVVVVICRAMQVAQPQRSREFQENLAVCCAKKGDSRTLRIHRRSRSWSATSAASSSGNDRNVVVGSAREPHWETSLDDRRRSARRSAALRCWTSFEIRIPGPADRKSARALQSLRQISRLGLDCRTPPRFRRSRVK
jgi:hypothetical protein